MKPWMIFVASSLLASQMVFAEVKTDYDKVANFSAYKTFAWKAVRKPTNNGMADNSLVASRVESAVNEQLLSRGMREDDSHPDVFLVYHIGSKERQQFESFPWYGIGWRRWGWAGGDLVVDHYTEGTIVVDMVDAKTNQIVWRAYCKDTGSSPLDVASVKNVDKLIHSAFKHYPPKQRG